MTLKPLCFERKQEQVFLHSVAMASLGEDDLLGMWQLWDNARGVMRWRVNRKINICKDSIGQEVGCYATEASGQ